MGYVRELLDPWGLLLALAAAGIAWAIHLSALGTVLVGLAMLFGRAGFTVWARRQAD